MNRFISRSAVLCLGALAVLGTVAVAQQGQVSRYTVEIVVFRSAGAGDEDFAARTGAVDASTGGLGSTPSSQRRLSDTAEHLRAAGGYRVLAHTAWSQAAAPWNSRRGISAAQLGLASAGFTGNVFLERGQFLHLGFDLHLADGTKTYTLSEVRRIKPNERNYFDHPAIGVIALVTSGE
jgi:hypothetical protein